LDRLYFFRKFLLIAENLFQNIFLSQWIFSENLFLNHKKVSESCWYITGFISNLLIAFRNLIYVLEIGVLNSFYNSYRGFPTWVSQSEHLKSMKTARKVIYIYIKFPKNTVFLKGFLLNRVEKVFFNLKSWGPLKNGKTNKLFIFRPRPIHIC
jgi:hypothetical protein